MEKIKITLTKHISLDRGAASVDFSLYWRQCEPEDVALIRDQGNRTKEITKVIEPRPKTWM